MKFTLRCGAPVLLAAALFLPGSALHPDWGLTPPGWPSFAYNAQHWARPNVAAQPLHAIHWQALVEESGSTFGHYGSPLVTQRNNIVFPVHTDNGFRIEGRRVSDGTLLWTLGSSYDPPSSGWMPVCQPVLTPVGGVAVPESGGRVLFRQSADAASSVVRTAVFFGAANYAANPSAYNNNVRINTPITCDSMGFIYFGFHVTGPTPLNLKSGIARIGPTGDGTWVPMSTAANDPSITRAPHNCAPALGPDGRTLYIGARDGNGNGYLLSLDRHNLGLLHRVRLMDPHIGGDAEMTDFSTASPMIAPDGQVFYGVFDAGLNNNDRGWLLHFSADLAQTLTPGAFGWDNTPSVFPAASCAMYSGSSPYLLMCKYNNYAGIGSGDGVNKIAVLDPNTTQIDPISGITIMKEVITKAGITPDPGAGPNAVREWCINTAAVDWIGHAAMANSEDGKMYKWNFDNNTLSEMITLTGGVGEAYTPTLIAMDGTVFAINDKILFAIGN